MRNWVPFWNGDVKSPSNKKAVQNYAQQVNGSSNANYSPMYDIIRLWDEELGIFVLLILLHIHYGM